MGKNWKDVKKAIHEEAIRIWFDMPEEVRMSRDGVFPSGAGTDNQYLGNLFFLNADTQAMGWWTIEPAIYSILKDESFDLDHAKKVFYYMNNHMAHLMGDVIIPGCPAPWMNLGTLTQFAVDIADSYDSIQTKEEFLSLLWSWFAYVNRLNNWFYTVFPWELGHPLRRHDYDYLETLAGYYGAKLIKK